MIKYETNASACTDRGAPYGRMSIHAEDEKAVTEITLSHVQVDEQGYDINGTYFGIGAPLFWAASPNGTVDFVLRQQNWEDAALTVRRRYPNAALQRGQDITCDCTMEET